jgi:hypothetical protein
MFCPAGASVSKKEVIKLCSPSGAIHYKGLLKGHNNYKNYQNGSRGAKDI